MKPFWPHVTCMYMYVEFIVQKSVLNRRQKHLKQQATGIGIQTHHWQLNGVIKIGQLRTKKLKY